MKKLIACLLALLMLAMCAASAERAVYADQGGVRVFSEDGLLGLEDDSGGVLLAAAYDEIRPFAGTDYAIVRQSDRLGIVRRDGTLAVECAWDVIELYPEARTAMCRGDSFGYQRLIDLRTGETLAEGARAFESAGRYSYDFSYGEANFGFEPPFHTNVYDADMNLVYSDDVWFVRAFGELAEGLAAVQRNDGTYAVLDADFNVLAEGMDSLPEIVDGAIYYTRSEASPIAAYLNEQGFDKDRVMRAMMKYWNVDYDTADALSCFMDPVSYCGVVRPDGTRTEVRGAEMQPLVGGEGPYCVKAVGWRSLIEDTDRYGYVDAAGEYEIPADYQWAFPFVEGSAVVRRDGRWRLIDATGAQVGDLSWDMEVGQLTALCLPVIAVPGDDGVRLVDRQGRYVSDETIPANLAASVANGMLLLMDDAGDALWIVDGTTGETLRRLDGVTSWSLYSAVPDVLWVESGGLWGVVSLDRADVGDWRIEPCCVDHDRPEEGGWLVTYPDDSRAYIDGSGAALAPAPPEEDDGW